MSSKEDECIFSWKLFTGWDYMIGKFHCIRTYGMTHIIHIVVCCVYKMYLMVKINSGHAETAHNRVASVVLGFKEALLEEAEKKKDTQK